MILPKNINRNTAILLLLVTKVKYPIYAPNMLFYHVSCIVEDIHRVLFLM